jgi:hypothetical protein
MTMSLSTIGMLFGTNSGSSGFDYALLSGGTSSNGGVAASAGSIKAALVNADKNEAKQIAQVAKDPQVVKDLARYEKVVKSAESMDDVINDPVARRVFMTANGLKEFADFAGMAKKVLSSDPSDGSSPAARLASINGTWYDTVQKYPVGLAGIGVLQVSDAIAEVKNNYMAEKRLDLLDAQLPGLGSAVLFKQVASKLEDALDVLGSGLGREVITTAFNIPKQIAVQSFEAQEKAINQRVDFSKLQKASYVDIIAQRYLLILNGGLGGITA